MRKCLVISPLGPGIEIRKHSDDVFNFLIEPAMEECNIKPFRTDYIAPPGVVSNQIIEAIFLYDLCIVDLSFEDPLVCYLLAVALCANRPVIILVEKSHYIPADLQSLRYITYDLKLTSYHNKIYINEIIELIKYFERNNWKVSDILTGVDFSKIYENLKEWYRNPKPFHLDKDVKTCFVMGPIDFEEEGSEINSHADQVYQHIIQPAMGECGIKYFRLDFKKHSLLRSQSVIDAILSCDFCAANLTYKNPNVLYELGIAKSAFRPVITLTNNRETLPFDLEDQRSIFYDLEITSPQEKIYINQLVQHIQDIEGSSWESPNFTLKYSESSLPKVFQSKSKIKEPLKQSKYVDFIKKLPMVYKEITIDKISLKTGLLTEQIEDLIKEMISDNEISARISGSRLIFEEKKKKEEKEGSSISHPVQMEKSKEQILAFASYAIVDAELFKIHETAELLTNFGDIKDVLYCEEDVQDSIIAYMNDNLAKSDILLLFCSPNANRSKFVKMEWEAALANDMPILPIFKTLDHVPFIIKPKLGIEFDQFEFRKTIKNIHELITKRVKTVKLT